VFFHHAPPGHHCSPTGVHPMHWTRRTLELNGANPVTNPMRNSNL
jgi:hypothetical protein